MDKKILGINKVISLIVLSAFLILIGCRERVEFTMSKDGSFTKDKYYLEKTKKRGDIKIISAVRDSEFYIFHILPSNPYYYSSSFGYTFLKYIGHRKYKINDEEYTIEGYESVWPIVMDGHEGLFFNDELNFIHLVNYDWDNSFYLSKKKGIDNKSLELLNNTIMSDTAFYYNHWLPVLKIN
jgi:hypothetical protein